MNGTSQAMINLLRGWPNPALLPVSQIKTATQKALSNAVIAEPALLYGPDPGFEPLREQLAQWLTQFYKPIRSIGAERICITGGASQNLANILQVYSDPEYTRNVWMVSPTYFLACRIFEDSGFGDRLRSVPEDEYGIDIEYLIKGLKSSEEEAVRKGNDRPKYKPTASRPWSKIYRHIIYAVPTFANPSSKTMNITRREQLVTVAREYDALIITDDVYDQLQWPASPNDKKQASTMEGILRIVDVDRYMDSKADLVAADGFGNAVSNGSFSKIVGPGCRTGWAEGTESFVFGLSQCGSSRSGGAPSQLTATFMHELIQSGDLQRHIHCTLQPAYGRRYRRMITAIELHLVPLGVTFPQPNRDVVGGYFVWLTLPEGLDADEVAARAKEEENLIVAQGSLFGVYGDTEAVDLTRGIRLCFAWEEEQFLTTGVERLARVVKRLQRDGKAGKGLARATSAGDTAAQVTDGEYL